MSKGAKKKKGSKKPSIKRNEEMQISIQCEEKFMTLRTRRKALMLYQILDMFQQFSAEFRQYIQGKRIQQRKSVRSIYKSLVKINKTLELITYNRELDIDTQLRDHILQNKLNKKHNISILIKVMLLYEEILITYNQTYFQYYKVYSSSITVHDMIAHFTRQFKQDLKIQSPICFKAFYSNRDKLNPNLTYTQFRQKYARLFIKRRLNDPEIILQLQAYPHAEQVVQLYKNQGFCQYDLICPISYSLMHLPVYIQSCKHMFDEVFIKLVLQFNKKCPICRGKASFSELRIDYTLKILIDEAKTKYQQIHKAANAIL